MEEGPWRAIIGRPGALANESVMRLGGIASDAVPAKAGMTRGRSFIGLVLRRRAQEHVVFRLKQASVVIASEAKQSRRAD